MCQNLFSHAPTHVPGACADVRGRVAGMKRQQLQQQIRALFLLAFRALQPISGLMAHDMRNFASGVKLPNSVGVVVSAISIIRRFGKD